MFTLGEIGGLTFLLGFLLTEADQVMKCLSSLCSIAPTFKWIVVKKYSARGNCQNPRISASSSCSEICLKHDSPFGVQYFRCEHGCCGTTYDRHCCIDSQTLTVVLSLLGSGVAIAVIVAVIWAMKTAHKRSKVAPEVAAVMTQTDTGVAS